MYKIQNTVIAAMVFAAGWALTPVCAQTRLAPGAAPPAVEQVRADIIKDCGGRANFKPGFQKTADFNGDGKPDYIVDYGETECIGGAGNSFCGSAGCLMEIFVSDGDGYRQGYSSNTRDWSVSEANGKAVLVLALHGSACGRVGAQTCHQRLSWNGKKFTGSKPR